MIISIDKPKDRRPSCQNLPVCVDLVTLDDECNTGHFIRGGKVRVGRVRLHRHARIHFVKISLSSL